MSLGAVSAVWKNPKYLHSKLHFNVLVASADLAGMHRSDISLRVIGALSSVPHSGVTVGGRPV